MARGQPGIAYGANNNKTLLYRFFDDVTKRIVKVGLFEISARGNIDDANSITVFVGQDPAHSGFDVALVNAAFFTYLAQDNVSLGSNTSVETIGKTTITAG